MAGEFDYQNRSVQWDTQGRPYVLDYNDSRGRTIARDAQPSVRYISPAEVHAQNSYGKDPKLASWAQQMGGSPGQSLWRERGQWDPKKGRWEQGFNWDNLANIGVGALIGGPAIAGMFGGPTAATVPAATTTGAGTTAAATTAPLLVNTAPAAWTTALSTAALPSAATAGGAAAIPVATGALAGLPSVAPVVRDLVGNTGGGGGNPFSGMSALDIAKLGQQAIGAYLSYQAQSGASEAQLTAAREALEFAKKAYEEQNAKEQARFEATEARRAPFREGALKAHMELRRIIGL